MCPRISAKADEKTEKAFFSTSFCDVEISFNYPDENPPDAVHLLTKALSHVGAFDAIG